MIRRFSTQLASATAGFCFIFSSPASGGSLKVFILAGQSNMQGQGVVSMDGERDYNSGKGNLVWSMAHSQSKELLAHLKDKDDNWVVRDDVTISYKVNDAVRKGGLTVGYTGYGNSSHIGPELGFGDVVGDHYKEPVLLIKTAWGGKSLFQDFRPPSSGGVTGPVYQQMVTEVKEALKDLGDTKYELSGFIWMQGWNDMISKEATAEYPENLIHLAQDIRKEFNAPNLPIVIGELGNGGPAELDSDMDFFRKAQQAGAEKIPHSVFVTTSAFARAPEMSPNPGHGHHWSGNAESYYLVGRALGKGILSLK